MFGSFGGGAKKAAAAKPAAKKGARPVAKKAARPVAKKAAKPVAKGKAAPAAADARPVRGDLRVANPDPIFRSQRFATGDIGVTPRSASTTPSVSAMTKKDQLQTCRGPFSVASTPKSAGEKAYLKQFEYLQTYLAECSDVWRFSLLPLLRAMSLKCSMMECDNR